MNIDFKYIKYFHEEATLRIAFYDHSNSICLQFDGGSFQLNAEPDLLQAKDQRTFPLSPAMEERLVITGIKETEDFEFLIQIDGTYYLKVFHFPDDTQRDGVIQTITLVSPETEQYESTRKEYEEEAENIELLN